LPPGRLSGGCRGGRCRIAVIALLVLFCLGLTYYFHFLRRTDIVFTHVFYVPIVLTALWWWRRALWVALLLGGCLVLSHLLSGLSASLLPDLVRFAMFIIVGLVAGMLRRQQAALREAGNWFDNLVRHASGPIIAWDQAGNITMCNAVFEALTGLRSEDVIGKPVSRVLEQEGSTGAVGSPAPGESGWREIEIPLRCADGSRRACVWNSTTLYASDESGGAATIALGRDISGSKSAEAALRRSQEQFRTIVEHSHDVIWMSDTEGKVVFCNRRAGDLCGLRTSDLVGRCFEELVGLKEAGRLEEIRQRVLAGGSLEHELNLNSAQGRAVSLAVSVVRVREGGRVVGTVSFGRDITERKEMEVALLDSEQELAAVVYGSPIPKFVIDRDHRVICWNKALEEVTGVMGEKVIGTSRHWAAFYEKERPCMADLLVDGKTGEIPEWYQQKSSRSPLVPGAYQGTDFLPLLGRWLHFTAATIRDSKGDVIGAVETLEDITESKLSEDSLRESEERFRMIFDGVSDAILIVEPATGAVLDVNTRMCEMYGYTRDEARALTVRDLSLGPDPEGLYSMMKAVREVPLTTEWPSRSRRGDVFWVEANMRRAVIAGQELLLVTVRDISERKRLEHQILTAGEREQRRLMSDLHDCLGQQLVALAFFARSLCKRISAAGGVGLEDADAIVAMATETMGCARDLASGLYPGELDRGDLVAALEKLAATAARVFRVPCVFRGERCAIPGGVSTMLHLYRIAQEAVNNAVKHGRATAIHVTLAAVDARIELVVEDDGVGIPDDISAGGSGLRIMRYRAEWIGWTLSVRRREEGGTRVACLWRNGSGATPANGQEAMDECEKTRPEA
jgi:PAS domain S-box-containing protein